MNTLILVTMNKIVCLQIVFNKITCNVLAGMRWMADLCQPDID